MAAPVERVDLIGTLADGRHVVRLLCEAQPFEAPASDGKPADKWIQVCPFGPLVSAKDGRTFQISDLNKLVAASELPCLVDWEHDSERWSGETRAAAWCEEFAVENGQINKFPRPGVWARAEFTEEGAKDVEGKYYRFLSPVLILDGETRDALQIVSVALTNRPALNMARIDSYREQLSARFGQLHQGEQTMDPTKRKLLLTKLGVKDTASDDELLAAAEAAISNAATQKELCSSLTTQLSAAQTENVQLKKKLADHETATFASDVKAVLDQATQEGKITPAARGGYETMCRTPELFKAFKENVLPHLVGVAQPAPPSKGAPTPPAPAGESGATTTAPFGLPRSSYDALKKQGMSDEDIKASVEHANHAADRTRFGVDEED